MNKNEGQLIQIGKKPSLRKMLVEAQGISIVQEEPKNKEEDHEISYIRSELSGITDNNVDEDQIGQLP